MCPCTHEDPYRCTARLGRSRCTCSCHRLYRVQQQPVIEPRDPLEEKDAEIARLRHQITVKDAALHVAHDWLSGLMRNYHPVGEEEAVNAAIETALDCKGEAK